MDVVLIITIQRRHQAGPDDLRNGQYGNLAVSVNHLPSDSALNNPPPPPTPRHPTSPRRKIKLGPTKIGLFEQPKRDTTLLQDLSMMDFSLIVALPNAARGNKEGLWDDQLLVLHDISTSIFSAASTSRASCVASFTVPAAISSVGLTGVASGGVGGNDWVVICAHSASADSVIKSALGHIELENVNELILLINSSRSFRHKQQYEILICPLSTCNQPAADGNDASRLEVPSRSLGALRRPP
ncbi:hypothetical protein PtB15_7B713 [Puccinia triticina]|nr:hypothetical protein PtB15_7B713 [Puccinia triticina]